MGFVPKIIYPVGGGTTITFDLPPDTDNLNEVIAAENFSTVSTDGTIQNVQDRQEEVLTINFVFVSATLTEAVRTLFKTHASEKKEFEYFDDKDAAKRGDYILLNDDLKIEQAVTDGAGSFLANFTLKMRKVL